MFKSITIGIVSISTVLVLSACNTKVHTIDDVHATPTHTKVTEDSPLWDCHTMGNMVCGTPTK